MDVNEDARVSAACKRIRSLAHPSVDSRRLYAWLGRQAEGALAEVNECSVSLDESAGPGYAAEAFAAVRAHMRRIDPSLPVLPVDREW